MMVFVAYEEEVAVVAVAAEEEEVVEVGEAEGLAVGHLEEHTFQEDQLVI